MVVLAALGVFPASAADVPGDVQRLQTQREQQQLELRLKMQQQQDWALQPKTDGPAGLRLRSLERGQQQRQQQFFDQQSREAISPKTDDAPTRGMALETQRRIEAERAAPAPPAPKR